MYLYTVHLGAKLNLMDVTSSWKSGLIFRLFTYYMWKELGCAWLLSQLINHKAPVYLPSQSFPQPSVVQQLVVIVSQ